MEVWKILKLCKGTVVNCQIFQIGAALNEFFDVGGKMMDLYVIKAKLVDVGRLSSKLDPLPDLIFSLCAHSFMEY